HCGMYAGDCGGSDGPDGARSRGVDQLEPGASRSGGAGRDVAVDLPAAADEDDAVSGGIAPVEFHLGVRHGNARAVRDHALAVGDDGDVVVALNLEGIGLERIRLAAAGQARMVGLLDALEPFTDVRGRVGPLTVVARDR